MDHSLLHHYPLNSDLYPLTIIRCDCCGDVCTRRNGTMFKVGPNKPHQDSSRWATRIQARPMELKRAFAEGNILDVHHK